MGDEAELALSRELAFHRRVWTQGLFVDVGAHVGRFSEQIGRLPGASILAIEPLPAAVAHLRALAAGAAWPMQVAAVAVSDRPGHAVLQVPVLAGGPVWEWASISKDFAGMRADLPDIVEVLSLEVPVVTIDSLDLAGVTAVKLDVEGAEEAAVRGAERLLRRARPVVSIELEERHRAGCTRAVPALMAAFGYLGFFELAGRLRPLGDFVAATMQRGSPSPASHDYSDPYINCFYFIPRERSDLQQRAAAAG